MKQEDIVALAKAGFTRDQIVALAGLQTARFRRQPRFRRQSQIHSRKHLLIRYWMPF